MKTIIQSIKGTRDFYPEEMGLRTWLYDKVRQVSESFGYQEYEGPFLESIDLYAAKSGEELVKEQSFVFPDRSGDLITLRPELTPSLVRMIAQRQKQLVYPLRWWSWGPMWRYERPQKGRTREFFQWNIDLIGVNNPEADAELIAIVAQFFASVGLMPEQVQILINNRRLMDSELNSLGVAPNIRPSISRWIDRREKMSPAEWDNYGRDFGLSDEQIAGIKFLLTDQDVWKKSDELVRLFAAVDALGIGKYVRFDPSIVRGLDYYTGTVFEAQEITGDFRRAILGGGRYDNLMADVGGEALSGIGFAMGDVVIGLILQQAGCLPANLGSTPAQVMVTVFNETTLLPAFSLASELRLAGLQVSSYPEPTKIGKQFKYADRMGIPFAVVMGPDELKNNQVAIKNLKSGDQILVDRAEAAKILLGMLAALRSS
jgi:histidyl-tRNA synthetase